MVTVLTGRNSYAVAREAERLREVFEGAIEQFEGAELELRQLPDLLTGTILFAEKRLVVIDGLSSNRALWEALPSFLERMSDDIHLVLIEGATDKRTKTYKTLQKVAEIKDFSPLTERDSSIAEQWLLGEAKAVDIKIDTAAAPALLRRSLVPVERGQPVIDQWQVMHSLDKLSVLGTITPELVEKYIDTQPVDSVFGVFETALKGNRPALRQLIADLEPREDPYKVFGLLTSQVFQLTALSVSEASPSDTAKEIGAHPFAAGKLASTANKLSKGHIRQIVLAMESADTAMKSSKGTPWLVIEQALMKIATIVHEK